MNSEACKHVDLEFRFGVPLDVKSDQKTRFGSVYQCTDCGLNLVNPQPGPDQVAEHYDLPAYYTHGKSHMPHVTQKLRDRIITNLAWRTDRGSPFNPAEDLPDMPHDGRALDIGCGSGTLLSKMKEMGMKTVGVDPDHNARLQAAKNGHKVYSGTAESLPDEIQPEQFDVITMTHVLEHCLSPVQALENARALLSEKGVFYCEVPNAGSLYFEKYSQISEMLDVPRHLYFFRKLDLEAMAAGAGLEITGWKFQGLTRHFSATWRSWENDIFDRLVRAGVTPSCPRRSVAGDMKLLATGIIQAPERRYDSIGFIARRQNTRPPA